MRRPKRKSENELKADCIVWNHEHPVGAAVIFHPVIGEKAGRRTVTVGEAYVLSGHTAVVQLKGVPGCVALEACEPVTEAAA